METRQQMLRSLLDAKLKILPALTLVNPHSAFILLKYCVNARAMYLARVCEITQRQEIFSNFDQEVLACSATIASAQLTSEFKTLHGLPGRWNGLGIIPHSGYEGQRQLVNSRDLCSSRVRIYHDYLQRAVDQWELQEIEKYPSALIIAPGAPTGSTGTVPRIPESSAANFEDEPTLLHYVRAHQERQWKALHTTLIDSNRPAQAAWLLSSSHKGSGRWLDWRGGVQTRFCLSPNNFRDALRLRLLLPPCTQSPAVPPTCRCDAAVNVHDEPYHVLDCKYACQFFWRKRHEKVIDLLAGFLRACLGRGVVIERELSMRNERLNKNVVCDLHVVHECEVYTIDVTICDPAARRYRDQGSPHDATTASKHRAAEKKAIYTGIQNVGTIVPFVIDATGRFSKDATTFIDTISSSSDHSMQRSYFFSNVSSCIAMYNSRLMKATRSSLMGQ